MERLEERQEQGGDVRFERAQVLYELGELNMYANREKAWEYYQQSLEMFQEIGDDENSGKVCTRLGEVVHHAGDYSLAGSLLSKALPLLVPRVNRDALLPICAGSGSMKSARDTLKRGNLSVREAIEVRTTWGSMLGSSITG